MTPDEAQAFLARYRAYSWLVQDPQMRPIWTTNELIEALQQSQILPNASRRLVNGWCEGKLATGERALPGATNFRSTVGWRIPREDLLVFFAERRAEQIVSDEKPT